jgi:hypothetical protein
MTSVKQIISSISMSNRIINNQKNRISRKLIMIISRTRQRWSKRKRRRRRRRRRLIERRAERRRNQGSRSRSSLVTVQVAPQSTLTALIML